MSGSWSSLVQRFSEHKKREGVTGSTIQDQGQSQGQGQDGQDID